MALVNIREALVLSFEGQEQPEVLPIEGAKVTRLTLRTL
jgi:hypothetical protein